MGGFGRRCLSEEFFEASQVFEADAEVVGDAALGAAIFLDFAEVCDGFLAGLGIGRGLREGREGEDLGIVEVVSDGFLVIFGPSVLMGELDGFGASEAFLSLVRHSLFPIFEAGEEATHQILRLAIVGSGGGRDG